MSSIGEEKFYKNFSSKINKSIFTYYGYSFMYFSIIEEDCVLYFFGLLFTLKVERYCNPYSNNSNSYAEELMSFDTRTFLLLLIITETSPG